MALRRTALGIDQFILAPAIVSPTGPVCDLCNDVVDSEAIVDGDPGEEDGRQVVVKDAPKTWCKVLVKHHGCEEEMTFDFGSTNWGPSDLKRYMQRHKWFTPEHAGK